MPSSKSPLTSMSISWPIDAMSKVSNAMVMRSTLVRPREAPNEPQTASAMSSPKVTGQRNEGETHEPLGLFL